MKNIMIIVAVLAFSLSAYTQTETGPKAKNKKAWKTEKAAVSVTTQEYTRVTGPAAKNQKAWEKTDEATQKVVVSNKPKQTGPKAKNYHPAKDQ